MEEDKRQRIVEWFSKSEREVLPFNKFICLWVSFNIFYGLSEQHISGDKNKVIYFSGKEKYKDLFIKALKEDKSLFFGFYNYLNEEKVYNKGYIKNFTESSSPARYTKIDSLREYLECCYLIRCNLFHGDKMESDAGDSVLVEKINPSFQKFLYCLYSECDVIKK